MSSIESVSVEQMLETRNKDYQLLEKKFLEQRKELAAVKVELERRGDELAESERNVAVMKKELERKENEMDAGRERTEQTKMFEEQERIEKELSQKMPFTEEKIERVKTLLAETECMVRKQLKKAEEQVNQLVNGCLESRKGEEEEEDVEEDDEDEEEVEEESDGELQEEDDEDEWNS
ncbi:unnamed protein product [Caenorhabditis sp. 36 PRJEB53466]|nr:unnamed protein product [Caenorhabditis sp. 36 PRJEB53466]